MMEQYTSYSNRRRRLKVLLAEDNLIDQEVASININKLGHEVDFAKNGKIALEKYKGQNYDIILMDLQMPVMGGIEATKRIREFEKSKTTSLPIKIIAMTACDLFEYKYICYEAGMNDYISKPFSREDLSRVFNDFPSA